MFTTRSLLFLCFFCWYDIRKHLIYSQSRRMMLHNIEYSVSLQCRKSCCNWILQLFAAFGKMSKSFTTFCSGFKFLLIRIQIGSFTVSVIEIDNKWSDGITFWFDATDHNRTWMNKNFQWNAFQSNFTLMLLSNFCRVTLTPCSWSNIVYQSFNILSPVVSINSAIFNCMFSLKFY